MYVNLQKIQITGRFSYGVVILVLLYSDSSLAADEELPVRSDQGKCSFLYKQSNF